MNLRYYLPFDLKILSFFFFVWAMSFIFRMLIFNEYSGLYGFWWPFAIAIYLWISSDKIMILYRNEHHFEKKGENKDV